MLAFLPNLVALLSSFPLVLGTGFNSSGHSLSKRAPSAGVLPSQRNIDSLINSSRYTTVKILGSGSFGTTYMATRTGDRTFYALKVARGDHEAIEMLKDEAENLFDISSVRNPQPNIIVPVGVLGSYSRQIYPGVMPFIIMVTKMTAGSTLHDAIHGEGTITTEDIPTRLDVFCEILAGVVQVHSAGFYHNDLKPDNILYDRRRMRLADFGLSSRIRIGLPRGAPFYRPPEALSGGDIDREKGDMWALGVILYQMSTYGRLPWSAPEQAREIARTKPWMRDRRVNSRIIRIILLLTLAEDPDNRLSASSLYRRVCVR